MDYTLKNKEVKNATFFAEVEIPKKQIEKFREKAVEELSKKVEVPGFRKGKAPKEVILKNLSERQILEETAKQAFTNIILDIIKKEKLELFGEPSVEPIEISFDKPWRLKVRIPLKPKITLPDYKKIVEKVKGEAKASQIWTPGKTKNEREEKMQKDILLNKILNQILKETKIELSEVIVDQEVKRRLAGLIEDVRKAGLTLEDYLKARNTDIETLKERYKKEVLDTYKLELVLEEIANKENIQVNDSDLQKALKIDKEKLVQNKQLQYYWAAVLRKQKTLEFLLSL